MDYKELDLKLTLLKIDNRWVFQVGEDKFLDLFYLPHVLRKVKHLKEA